MSYIFKTENKDKYFIVKLSRTRSKGKLVSKKNAAAIRKFLFGKLLQLLTSQSCCDSFGEGGEINYQSPKNSIF